MRSQFAYLDPVTGGALIQVLLGGLAAVGLGYQYIRKGVSGLLSKIRGTRLEDPDVPVANVKRDAGI